MSRPKRGVYPDFTLKEFVEAGFIRGKVPIDCSDDGAIGPSSIDLTLSRKAYQTVGSATPKPGETVEDMLGKLSAAAEFRELDLEDSRDRMLHKGAVYIVELNESLELTNLIRGRTNTKSSLGRLDIFCRVLADGVDHYDEIPVGYRGRLYLEIIPKTFNIIVKSTDPLTQMRLHTYHSIPDFTIQEPELQAVSRIRPLLFDGRGNPMRGCEMDFDGLFLSADLEDDVVGYMALNVDRPIDISKAGFYPAEDFWTPVRKQDGGYTRLNESGFFIIKSRELLAVPPEYAVEIVPHNERLVEARVHYAGFAHPGFGYDPEGNPRGTPLIFEIRARDAPIALRDGKNIAKLYFNEMYDAPHRPYNARKNSYGDQGLTLSRVFRPFRHD